MIDTAYLTKVLRTLLLTPSPVGMTEKAVAQTHQWLTELGFILNIPDVACCTSPWGRNSPGARLPPI
jgi:hypothetical protein